MNADIRKAGAFGELVYVIENGVIREPGPFGKAVYRIDKDRIIEAGFGGKVLYTVKGDRVYEYGLNGEWLYSIKGNKVCKAGAFGEPLFVIDVKEDDAEIEHADKIEYTPYQEDSGYREGESNPRSITCPNCQNKVSGNAKFCPLCGRKIEQFASEQAEIERPKEEKKGFGFLGIILIIFLGFIASSFLLEAIVYLLIMFDYITSGVSGALSLLGPFVLYLFLASIPIALIVLFIIFKKRRKTE